MTTANEFIRRVSPSQRVECPRENIVVSKAQYIPPPTIMNSKVMKTVRKQPLIDILRSIYCDLYCTFEQFKTVATEVGEDSESVLSKIADMLVRIQEQGDSLAEMFAPYSAEIKVSVKRIEKDAKRLIDQVKAVIVTLSR